MSFEALSRIDDELHGVNYELYLYLHDVLWQAMARACGEDDGHEDCIAHVLKAELDKAKAVIAAVKKLPDEWEAQDAKAQWPADVPTGSQCADDLRAILGDN